MHETEVQEIKQTPQWLNPGHYIMFASTSFVCAYHFLSKSLRALASSCTWLCYCMEENLMLSELWMRTIDRRWNSFWNTLRNCATELENNAKHWNKQLDPTSTNPKHSKPPTFSKSCLMQFRHCQPILTHGAQSSVWMDLRDAIISWILLLCTIFPQHFLNLTIALLT